TGRSPHFDMVSHPRPVVDLGTCPNEQPADTKDDAGSHYLFRPPPLRESSAHDCHANDSYTKPDHGLHFWCSNLRRFEVFQDNPVQDDSSGKPNARLDDFRPDHFLTFPDICGMQKSL